MTPRRAAGLRGAAAGLLVLAFMAPLAILVLGALRRPGRTPPQGAELFEIEGTTAAFDRAFSVVPLARQLANSLLVVGVAVPLTIVFASLTAFAFTRLGPAARRIALGFTLVCLTIPLPALWVPRFAVYRSLGVLDTYIPLWAPALVGTSPVLVLLAYWSTRRIPADTIDAARLAGLDLFRIWWRVVVPLTRPTLFAVGALAFVFHWSNFIDPLLYLFSPELATLPLGLSALRQLPPVDAPALLAAALVATLPPVVAFILVQRRFLDETRGAGWLGR